MKLSPDELNERVSAYLECGTERKAAKKLNIAQSTLHASLVRASKLGLMPKTPVMPGFEIKSVASKDGDAWIKQTQAPGARFVIPEGHRLKGVSSLVSADGRVTQSWMKTAEDVAQREAAVRAAVEAFKDEIPRAYPVSLDSATNQDLLSQYTVTDVHLGALAWNEETLAGDYNLTIGEQLLMDWFAAAIQSAPASNRAVFAQLGDFLHYDSFKSITSESGHLLDSDTRYPKMVRVAIRSIRRIIQMLLAKHERIDLVMSDANHDSSSEVWLRELFAAFYDEEPRVFVETSPSTYSCIEHGEVSLFYHHGHRRGVKQVDRTFAGKFRKVYGRTKFSYAHLGHKHSDELLTTDLMKVEQHETLAAPDSYGSNWLSGRSAKVITYSKKYGEVGRLTFTPAMVAGLHAANDNDSHTLGEAA